MTSNFYTPRMTPINKGIIIGTVALFILSSILKLSAGSGLEFVLGLSGAKFFSGHFYQALTYPFIGTGLFEVIFDCLMIWFIGCELEQLWGRGKYLVSLVFAVTLSAGFFLLVNVLFPSLSGFPLTGLAGICNAQLVAYALIYPDRQFAFFMVFPMKAKWFCLILLGMQVYLGIFSPSGVLAWGHMGGMLAGFLFVKMASWKALSFKFQTPKKKRGTGNLRLVKGEEDKQPKYWQ